MEQLKGVITGDIVGSRKFADYRKLIRSLETVMYDLEESGLVRPGMWEIFKGDSFQVLMEAEDVVAGALMIRAGLLGRIYRLKSVLILEDVLEEPADARLSVGIGKVYMDGSRVTDLFGEGLMISGMALDSISQESLRLLVVTPDAALNRHYALISRMLDALIGEWTENSAQAVYRSLLTGETQQEMGRFFGISQSSVHHRLKGAYINQVEHAITYFREQVRLLQDGGSEPVS